MVRYSDGSSSQWRAFQVRAVIAVLIALFTLVSSLMKGDINPITGEKQRVGMSVDQEIVLGLEALSEMAAQHGGLHAELLSTHPKPANRKEYSEEVIHEVFPDGVPGGLHE